MSFNHRAPNGYASVSQTARAAEMMHGMHIEDLTDTRPMPNNEQLQAASSAIMAAVTDNLSDSGLEPDLECLAWSLVNAFEANITRLSRKLDENELHQKTMLETMDGSEISSVQLEELTQQGHNMLERREAIETMRDAAAQDFEQLTGTVWRPFKKSKVNHRNMTAAMIESRDYINAKRFAETNVLLPKGSRIVFSGGVNYNDVDKIWSVLDKVKAKYPDMILLHSAKKSGADKIAACWAQARGVTEIGFSLVSRGPDDRSAGFRRNDQMLETNPVGVIVFPGPGTVLNIVTKARQLGMSVLDLTKA
jgi:hypothetical protein